MLLIFSTNTSQDCRVKLGSVLCQHQDLDILVVQSIAEVLAKIESGVVKAVFCLGTVPLEACQAAGFAPKNRKVTGLRKSVLHIGGVPMMVSYSPSIGEVDHSQFVDLLTDTNLACKLAKNGTTAPEYGDYRYTPDLTPVVQGVKALLGHPEATVPLAFDTETLGLDRFHPQGYVVSLQFSFKKGTAWMVAWKSREESLEWLRSFKNQQDLHWLLNEPQIRLRAANGKYDLGWVYEHTGITCTNFTTDTTLIGSLLDENRSNGLDVHAKIYAPRLAGYCVSPETRIWKSDLTWVQADDIEVGDTLVGFDEHPVQAGHRRKLRKSVVLSKQYLELPGRRITMKSGLVLNVSFNHAWLAKKPTAQGNLTWLPSDELVPGTRIKRIADVLEPRTDFEGGWFSGILDGEGWTCQPSGSNTFRVGFAQKNGLVLQKALKIAGSQVSVHSVTAGRDVINVTSKGSFGGLSWLQLHRPVRLLSKEHWFGSSLPQEDELDYVVENIPLPLIKVVSLKTTTHTFVAEGLASHNSDDFDSKTDKSRMDLAYANDPKKFLNYSAGDADATLEVAEEQVKQLVAIPPLARFYVNILHPAARAFEVVEQGGVFIDLPEFNLLEADLIADLHSLTNKAKAILGGSLVARHFDQSKTGGLNLTKASLITDFMFTPRGLNLKPKMLTEKTKAPVTSMEHLEMFKDVEEAKAFVSLMSEFSSTNKTLSTYINGFRQHIRSDGRFHPSYFLFAGNKDEGDGGTNCMPAGELVLTNRGYLPVEQVTVGDLVISHTGKAQPVVATILNGVQPIAKVTLSNGLVLRTTPNHAYLIGEDWVEAGNLKPGMQAWSHSEPEEWAPILGWEDFRVSSWGRVLNTKTNRLMTQRPKGKWGHLKVCLYRNGAQTRGPDRKDFTAHKLVAKAFVEKMGGSEVRHLNGFAWDNTADNLVWGSALDNRQDAVEHGTMSRRNGTQNKLTEEAVDYIRSQPRATRTGGVTNAMLAAKYGVCERLIREVRAGRRWQELPPREKIVKFKPVTVVSVEIEAPEMTYGLTVRDDHSHVTGGVVTHNTGRISVKDPAFQCCKGSTLVYNEEGWTSLQSIVEAYEQGKPFTVLTHTGEWKPVVGVYRNGIKPLLKITTKSGAVLECTGNHPWLTDYGFVQAEKLAVGSKVWRFYEAADSGEWVSNRTVDGDRRLGDRCQGSSQVPVPVRVRNSEGVASLQSNWDEAEQVLWLLQAGQADNAWSQSQRGSLVNLLVLAAHEGPLLRPEQQGLQDLWSAGHNCLRFVERFVRHLSSRYGRETAESHVREIGRKWELLQGQLHMGHGLSTGQESDKLSIPDVERGDQTPVRLGFQLGGETLVNSHEITSWVEYDSSPYHAFQAHQAGFEQDTIVSIEAVPAEETFDLTIENSHSFVANGLVVHNTIPKHTHWGKRIRRCYNAPPGMLVAEEDYSQGELKVMACLANEDVMIEAYLKKLDLHVVTSSFVAGLTYEEMMALKKTDKDRYDAIRQLGKAGNFGLIYGMGIDGFIEYARISYGVIMDYDKAAEFHAGFFTRYPGLPNYHKAYKAFAHQHGYVMSPLGRRRNLPMINSKRGDIRSKDERRAVNAPVQSTLSDMMLWAIAIQNDMGWFTESPCFGAIHDASYFYVPEDNYEFYVKRSMDVMENLPFHKLGWTPQLKFTADGKAGKNMADLKEVKFT